MSKPTLRSSALVVVSALTLSLLSAAPAQAASDEPPVLAGIYLAGPGWAPAGSRISIALVDEGCAPGTIRAYWNGSGDPLDTQGLGYPDWGTVRDYLLPEGISGSGTILVQCTSEAAAPIEASLPITIRATAPASIYHSLTQWTLSGGTFSMTGFTPGETVRVAFYDQSLYEQEWNLPAALAKPVTVKADGSGAVTATVTRPSNWTGNDAQAIVSSTSSKRVFDTSFEGDPLGANPTLTAPARVGRGLAFTVTTTGFSAGEKVVVALHSPTAPAVVLGTLSANSSGKATGSVKVPSGTALGNYRLWVGAKAISYLLQSRVITVDAVFTAGKATISGTAKVGKTLTAKPGTWKPVPSFSYQWLRDGSPIKNATKSTYKLTSSDKGKKISVKVTATKSGYATATVTSSSTAKVKKK